MFQEAVESLESQLQSLYAEREELHDRIGASSAEEIVGMVECLEAQLQDFYSRFGGIDMLGEAEVRQVTDQISGLGNSLDTMYSSKTVEFTFDDGKPTLRAFWNETSDQS